MTQLNGVRMLFSYVQVVHHRPEISKGQLDFGTLAMGEKRTMNFTLRNDNPVDVRFCMF